MSGRDEAIPRGYGEIFVGTTPEDAVSCKILQSGVINGRPWLACTLASDRTAAEKLTHRTVFVVSDRVAGDDPLWVDLNGMKVVDAVGVVLGTIEHVYNAGASDILTVVAADGKKVDIPVAPPFVGDDAFDADDHVRLGVGADAFADLWL